MKKLAAVLCGACLAGAVSAQTLYPANGATEAAYDAQLVLTFDAEPELVSGSFVTIYDANGAVIDKIAFTDDEQVFADGTKVAVGSQLVRKEGKAVYIQPHYGKIAPSATYSVEVPAAAIKAEGFGGVAKGAWSFSTKAAPATVSDGATLTVNNSMDAANNAQFHSIQAALDFVKDSEGTYTIVLAPATYYELLHYNGKANIILQGRKGNKRGDDTVITYINCNDMNNGQATRVVFLFTRPTRAKCTFLPKRWQAETHKQKPCSSTKAKVTRSMCTTAHSRACRTPCKSAANAGSTTAT